MSAPTIFGGGELEALGEVMCAFVYGYKRALPGLEKGMEGMKAGGRRTVVIPAKYAFKGARQESPDGVSVDSTLIIDVELVDVVPQANAAPANE